jgi:hypothetical protein
MIKTVKKSILPEVILPEVILPKVILPEVIFHKMLQHERCFILSSLVIIDFDEISSH